MTPSHTPKVISDHERSPAVVRQYFLERQAKAMKTPEMCSIRRYGSTEMPHDLFRSGHDLDLGQIFNMTFKGIIMVLSTRLDKKNMLLAK